MELIKKFFADKSRIAILSVCLLMLSVAIVSALTGETLASDVSGDGDVTIQATSACYKCYSNTNILKWATSDTLSSNDLCSSRYIITSITEGNCKTYTITYNANNGTGAPSKQYKAHGKDISLSETKPTRNGYTFLGWSVIQVATVPSYQPGDTYNANANANVTLYAVWSEDKACFQCNTDASVVKWDTNGSGDTSCSNGYHNVSGVSKETDCIVYKVSFSANNGSGAPATQYQVKGKSITLSTTKPTRTGYRFLGWNASSSATSATYQPGDIFSTNNPITLYAVWEANKYTVTYNANGGTGTMALSNYTYGVAQALRANIFTKDGCTFDGWNTEPNGTGKNYTDKQSVTIAENLNLYAQWKTDDNSNGGTGDSNENEITYMVKYNANGGSWSITGQKTWDISNVYGKNYILPGSNPSRSGYTFEGWYTKAEGGIQVTPKTKVENKEGHTLYAHWKDNYDSSGTLTTVKATFNTNQGSPASYEPRECKYPEQDSDCAIDVSDLKPTRSGYDFKGWGTSSSCTFGDTVEIRLSSSKTFYACWKKTSTTTTKYTISYNANGGKGAPSSQTKTNGTSITLRTGVPTRDGYEFLGWSTSSNATSATYQPGGTYSTNANATLHAVWAADEYTITYNANGGTGTMSNSNYTYGVAKALSDNTFTKDGSTFKCWNTKADGTGINYADKQSITISEDLTLYAQWTSNDSSDGGVGDSNENEITYIVRYNANGGTGTMNDDEHVYNFAKSLTKNTFTRIGYNFSGWNTKADETGISYADGATVGNLASKEGTVVTLYAQWVLNIISEDDGETESGENKEYPTVNLSLDKAYDTKLDLSVNISNITDDDKAEAEIYLIPMEGTGFETGSSYVIDTIKNCKNGKNISTITDLKPDTKYTFQVVLLTETGSVLGKEYVTFKTEPKKSIIENITESPPTGMLATILVSLICISSLGGLVYYRKKINNNI